VCTGACGGTGRPEACGGPVASPMWLGACRAGAGGVGPRGAPRLDPDPRLRGGPYSDRPDWWSAAPAGRGLEPDSAKRRSVGPDSATMGGGRDERRLVGWVRRRPACHGRAGQAAPSVEVGGCCLWGRAVKRHARAQRGRAWPRGDARTQARGRESAQRGAPTRGGPPGCGRRGPERTGPRPGGGPE